MVDPDFWPPRLPKVLAIVAAPALITGATAFGALFGAAVAADIVISSVKPPKREAPPPRPIPYPYV